MTPKIDAAASYADRRHAGQMYGDLPYTTHVRDVAKRVVVQQVNSGRIDEDEVVAALLHDVVEDTEATLEEISTLFGPKVAGIVSLLTKNEELSYRENIQRIIDSGNRSAMRVKLADNKANAAGDKSKMKQARRERLEKQYGMSIAMLEEALNEE